MNGISVLALIRCLGEIFPPQSIGRDWRPEFKLGIREFLRRPRVGRKTYSPEHL